jgi:hypothetical protein
LIAVEGEYKSGSVVRPTGTGHAEEVVGAEQVAAYRAQLVSKTGLEDGHVEWLDELRACIAIVCLTSDARIPRVIGVRIGWVTIKAKPNVCVITSKSSLVDNALQLIVKLTWNVHRSG